MDDLMPNGTGSAHSARLFDFPAIVRIVEPNPLSARFAFCCQVCGEPITDLGNSVVSAYDPSDTTPPIRDVQTCIVSHKGSCADRVAALLGHVETSAWLPLTELVKEALRW